MDPVWISGLLLLLFFASKFNVAYSYNSSMVTDFCKNMCDRSQVIFQSDFSVHSLQICLIFFPDKSEADECERACRFYDKFTKFSSEESDEEDDQSRCNRCNIPWNFFYLFKDYKGLQLVF